MKLTSFKIQVTPEQNIIVQTIIYIKFGLSISIDKQAPFEVYKFIGTYLFIRPTYITYGYSYQDNYNKANPLPELTFNEFMSIYGNYIKDLPMCPKCGTNNVSQDEDGQYTCNVCEN